jgi:CO dehydrogenase/acetyl-CoA synthase alpha subunit
MYKNVPGLIDELKRRDVIFEVQGDKLQYDAPTGVVTPEIQETLKQHKKQVIRYLQAIQSDVYWIWSDKLGEIVILCKDEGVAGRYRNSGHACFLFNEADRLKGVSDDMLKSIAVAKRVFPGPRCTATN